MGRTEGANVLQLFTPKVAAHRSNPAKLVLAGFSLGALALAGTVAISSFCLLLVAMSAIYFLATQVLGLQLEIDPSSFVQRAQSYAQNFRN